MSQPFMPGIQGTNPPYATHENLSTSQPTIQRRNSQPSLQKFNLVEKKKRKLRSGKKRGPQEQFIFHLKLEEQKKKRQKTVHRGTSLQQPSDHLQQMSPHMIPSNTIFSNTSRQFLPVRDELLKQQYLQQQEQLKQLEKQLLQHSQQYLGNGGLNTHSTSGLYGMSSSPMSGSSLSNVVTTPFKQDNQSFATQLQNYKFPLTKDDGDTEDTSTKQQYQEPKLTQFQTQQLKAFQQGYTKQRRNSIIHSIVTGLHQAKAPTTVTLTDGCIVKCNDAMCKLLGYTATQLESTMIQNVIHPDDKNINNLLLLQMLAANSDTCTHDIRLVTSNGKVIRVVQEVCCIRNNNGIPQWLVTRMTNTQLTNEVVPREKMNFQHCICDHKSNCDQVFFNESPTPFIEMFVGVLERLFGLSQPTCFYDTESTIIWNNDAFDRLFGVKGRPFIGKKAIELDVMKGTAMEILTRSVLNEQPPTLECQFVPTSVPSLGKKLAVRCYGQRVDKQDGSLFGYLWLFAILDDTQQKQQENQEQQPTEQFLQPVLNHDMKQGLTDISNQESVTDSTNTSTVQNDDNTSSLQDTTNAVTQEEESIDGPSLDLNSEGGQFQQQLTDTSAF